MDVDMIFACGMPSALALRDLMGNRNIPVVYAPVFNPGLAGLVDADHEVLRNFTGVSGMVDAGQKISMMEKIITVSGDIC